MDDTDAEPVTRSRGAGTVEQRLADARTAVATELATALGVKHFPHEGGHMFLGRGERAVYLTPGGKILPASSPSARRWALSADTSLQRQRVTDGEGNRT